MCIITHFLQAIIEDSSCMRSYDNTNYYTVIITSEVECDICIMELTKPFDYITNELCTYIHITTVACPQT